jgi:hypothetical protein
MCAPPGTRTLRIWMPLLIMPVAGSPLHLIFSFNSKF